MLRILAHYRIALITLTLIALTIALAAAAVNAAPMPGGVYIGYVYVNGVETSDFTVGVSLGPTYYWTEYYPPGDPIGTYEMDITIPDEGATTGAIVCTVPGVGTQTLDNVDLMQDYVGCNWYFTNASPPAANFSADVLSGIAPLTVQFTDTSVNASSWQWDFGDGTPNSTLQNPAHEYTAPGTYTVNMTATNAAGSDTLTETAYIVVSAPASASATITGYSIPGAMICGQPYAASVTVKNTGSLPWNESSMFRLGMVGDDSGDAYKFDGTTARIWLPAGANVLPGQSVTFSFVMTAPMTTGTYMPEYRMVWDGHQWFGDQLTTTINVAPLVDAQITGNTIPGSMTAGGTYNVSITAQNTGSLRWNESSMFRLGMVGDDSGDAYKFDGTTARIWLPTGANVLPGQSVTFSFVMKAPAAGTYQPQYRLVWDGHQWFGQTLSRQVTTA